MAQAPRDENRVTVILGTLNTDGVTPVAVTADPVFHTINTDDNITGTDLSGDIASRDENFVPVWMAVSSTDGVTPTAVYVMADGQLMIDSS